MTQTAQQTTDHVSTGLGLLHRDHRWLGREVEDTASGRRGVLRAIAPDGDKPRPVAWLQSTGGGTEWTTDPGSLANPAPLTADTHPGEAR